MAHIDKFTSRPLISVVMPVYETPEKALRDAIHSLISQCYTNWELCIADDGSVSPHVRDVLEIHTRQDSRIKCVFRGTNGHISAASNSALAIATGEYIALFDHDDVLSEHALYMVVEFNSSKSNCRDFLFLMKTSSMLTIEELIHISSLTGINNFSSDKILLNHLSVYKRSAIERVGGFRVGFEGSRITTWRFA